MVSILKPVNAELVHEIWVTPFVEGTERMNRAWQGIHIHSLSLTPLSKKERIISFISGMILLIPLINTIVWVVWQTFGQPERLCDPYSPESVAPTQPIPAPAAAVQEPVPALAEPIAPPEVIPIVPAVPGEAPRPQELFAYNETSREGVIKTNWKIETYPEMYVTQQYCDSYASTAIYTPDWKAKEYHHVKPNGNKFEVWLKEGHKLEMRLLENSQEIRKEFQLPPGLPWIQQPTVGFKNFILSNDQQIRFYGASPKNKYREINPFAIKPPFAIPFIARKVGEEEVAWYGRLVKVEIVSEWGWPYNSFKGHLWFDPQTGSLRKFIDPIEDKTGEYILERPLPVPARP